jgi:hypothetical protein
MTNNFQTGKKDIRAKKNMKEDNKTKINQRIVIFKVK